MCGIVGYVGGKQAQPILLKALTQLEYRGYDSCGIAVRNGKINVYKDKIRAEQLRQTAPLFRGNSGIGHTRWATHGEPNQVNAHPHCDCTGKIAVVHNGVINNYRELKERLIAEGHRFLSETDTEVIAHLIEKYYQGDIEKATATALKELEGCYAVVVMFANETRLVVAKNGNPLIIGIGDGENIVASDVPALLETTNRVVYLEDGDIGVVNAKQVKIINNGMKVTREITRISWTAEDLKKGGYDHFMLKEIHEQPRVIRDTFSGFSAENPRVEAGLVLNKLSNNLLILACGTSYHAGLLGKYIFEDLLDIPVRVELASEVNHRDHIIKMPNILAISQSGETADVIIAIKKLQEMGSYISAITNVRGSSISHLADKVIYTTAGPEVSVAATKSFMAQLIILYQLALEHPMIDPKIRERLMTEFKLLPYYVERVLYDDGPIEGCALFLSDFRNVFFIGRGINYPIALEGALKLKEISYIHAEGYAAGELKHGPFSLLTAETPVVAVVAQDKTYDSMLNNIQEIKARKAPVIALISDNDETTEKLADLVIKVPATLNIFSPVVNTAALQLLAYYVAKTKACPIDFPRNLAKCVTVE
jgi:glucosamine--fructose-6-phosphate aminotransferase (isomerizing)